MYEKRQKMEFSDLKYLLCSGIFLSGIGGYMSTGFLNSIHGSFDVFSLFTFHLAKLRINTENFVHR